jgi:hypothetical protein
MKFRKEYTFMTSVSDEYFKHQGLAAEVILLTQKLCHATACAFNRTDWSTFSTQALNIETMLLEN